MQLLGFIDPPVGLMLVNICPVIFKLLSGCFNILLQKKYSGQILQTDNIPMQVRIQKKPGKSLIALFLRRFPVNFNIIIRYSVNGQLSFSSAESTQWINKLEVFCVMGKHAPEIPVTGKPETP